ncbi:hypothetical protein K7X08_011757 [Anisodus acutangulus]|uniref:Uncharacterized protein n=1 Tax=Anisodus acutangulus TaxID=402998 RepID=A0A9Q1MND8_9SOLA|nr:hypothetical protein K7X08_011757 [Anisodus acutangulus]
MNTSQLKAPFLYALKLLYVAVGVGVGVSAFIDSTCLAHLSVFICGLIIAFFLSWRLALASFPLSLGFVIPRVAFGSLLMKLSMKMKDTYGIAGIIAEQAISSIRTIYSYVGESQMRRKRRPRFYIAASLVLGGLSCMAALPNLSIMIEAMTAASKIFELIDRKPEIDSEDTNGRVLAYVRGHTEFKEVSFSYPSRPQVQGPQKFCLKVKSGKTVGIVGGRGSGKSTIVCLLERFYDLVKGDILLDGHKIKRLKLQWLRSQMGLVNQEPVLFATSIKENILFGSGASMEMVIEAAKDANAHEFIVNLPNGYDTHDNLDFNCRAIARALIKDPRILLLDEATSALDAQSERLVQEAIDQDSQGWTTIVIAHRLTTIRKADKIIVLQSGTIVETGSHDKLMQINEGEGKVYFNMVKLQQSTSSNNADSPYRSKEATSYLRRKYANIQKFPFIARSSCQNSTAAPFSPAISTSYAPSIQSYSFCDNDYESSEINNST